MNAVRRPFTAFDRTPRVERALANATNERARILSSVLEQLLCSNDDFESVAVQTTRFLIEILGYDSGLVLQRREGRWQLAAQYGDPCAGPGALLELAEKGQICYRPASPGDANPKTILSIPVQHVDGQIAAVVYAERSGLPGTSSAIDSLEGALAELFAQRLGVALMFHGADHLPATAAMTLADTVEQEVTVLFCDVRGFSKLAEQTSPQLIGGLISEFMEFAGARIQAHGGRIVDCYGDGLLAMWTAQQDKVDADSSSASHACDCALAIRDSLEALSARWEIVLGEPLRVGISLNTGLALVGNTGSQQRNKYGPFGHTVNLACRVERAVKYFDLPILMTQATAERLSAGYATRRLGRVRLSGLSQTVELHELRGQGVDLSWAKWSQSYERAMSLFEAGQWEAVCQVLAPLLSRYEGGHDQACLRLLACAVDCLRRVNTPSSWVFEVRE